MVSSNDVILERRGGVVRLTLDRSDRANTLDWELAAALRDACDRCRSDETVRVVVLTAAGPSFCAGIDYQAIAAQPDRDWLAAVPFESLASLPAITIAAIQGAALGGGLELALACDLRIAADDATFALPEVSRGRFPSGGATQRLPRIVGRAKALELILTGDPIDAAGALHLGLANRVVPRAELTTRVDELADQFANGAPIALRYAKEAVQKGAELPLDVGLRYEADLYLLIQTTQDRLEGIRSFLEKRPPRFSGA